MVTTCRTLGGVWFRRAAGRKRRDRHFPRAVGYWVGVPTDGYEPGGFLRGNCSVRNRACTPLQEKFSCREGRKLPPFIHFSHHCQPYPSWAALHVPALCKLYHQTLITLLNPSILFAPRSRLLHGISTSTSTCVRLRACRLQLI